jgi:hypothetical protein
MSEGIERESIKRTADAQSGATSIAFEFGAKMRAVAVAESMRCESLLPPNHQLVLLLNQQRSEDSKAFDAKILEGGQGQDGQMHARENDERPDELSMSSWPQAGCCSML